MKTMIISHCLLSCCYSLRQSKADISTVIITKSPLVSLRMNTKAWNLSQFIFNFMSVDRKRKRCSLPSPSLIFPDEVRLCKSSVPGAKYGVCAAQPIPPGTWIGPYEGQVVRREELREGIHNSFMWEVRKCYLKCQSVMNLIIHRHRTSFFKREIQTISFMARKYTFCIGRNIQVRNGKTCQ